MNYKSNKGSITLYIVLSFLFFLSITIGTFLSIRNKEVQQEQEIDRIQETYNEVSMSIKI